MISDGHGGYIDMLATMLVHSCFLAGADELESYENRLRLSNSIRSDLKGKKMLDLVLVARDKFEGPEGMELIARRNKIEVNRHCMQIAITTCRKYSAKAVCRLYKPDYRTFKIKEVGSITMQSLGDEYVRVHGHNLPQPNHDAIVNHHQDFLRRLNRVIVSPDRELKKMLERAAHIPEILRDPKNNPIQELVGKN